MAAYNFSLTQGESFQANLNLKDSAGAYINLTGAYYPSGQIRFSFGSTGVIHNFIPAIDPSYISGLMIITLSAADTALFPVGFLKYDVELTSGTTVTKVLNGKIIVSPEITR